MCYMCNSFCTSFSTSPPYNTTATYSNTGVFANMIVNGDFAAGNAGFTSGYGVDCIAPPTTGSYCVGATAGAVNPFWWLQAGNPGLFLFADGSTVAGTDVWCENIAVTQNTEYIFATQFNNIVNPTQFFPDPQMRVLINNVTLLTTALIPENPNVWINATAPWCSDANTNANICIRSISTNGSGNDFGIDNIQFFESSAQTTLTEPNSCSCDPNDKLVGPKG